MLKIDQQTDDSRKHFVPDLQTIKESVYAPCGWELSNLALHTESRDYSACSFELGERHIVYRASKITPTKTGQFVTIWKRNPKGITAPFDLDDKLDFLVITSVDGDQLGQFIFPRSVLQEKAILSQNGKAGKRGMRVYPPWEQASNKQAQKTQSWQLQYFLLLSPNTKANLDRARELFNTATR